MLPETIRSARLRVSRQRGVLALTNSKIPASSISNGHQEIPSPTSNPHRSFDRAILSELYVNEIQGRAYTDEGLAAGMCFLNHISILGEYMPGHWFLYWVKYHT